MDVTEPVSSAVAFVAGVLSFLSPCVLPLIPGYVAFLSGRSLEELASEAPPRALLWSTAWRAVTFVLGFTLVFTALGASASAIGRLVSSWLPVLTKVAGGIIVVFGLHTMGVLQIPWLQREGRLTVRRVPPGMLGAGLMGVAFAFGWTPCIGPILASILALAATQDTVRHGIVLLLIYSLGLGIPFLLTAIGLSSFLRFFARYKRYIRTGEICAGALLVVVGVLVFTNQLTRLIQFIPSAFYRFAK